MNAGILHLKFDMGDEDQRSQATDAMNARSMSIFIYEFQQELRKIYKYEELSDKEQELINRIYDIWFEIKRDNDLLYLG